METFPNIAMGDNPYSDDEPSCINCGRYECDGMTSGLGCPIWKPRKHDNLGVNVEKEQS